MRILSKINKTIKFSN